MKTFEDQTGGGQGDGRRSQFVSLQVLRGLAAVAVVFYHVYIILLEPEYGAAVVFQPIARHGFLGVCFFFVLSGFIISLAHVRDIGAPRRAATYLYKRFIRVYPAYWIYLTGFILAAVVGFGHPDFSFDGLNLASAYLLAPLKSGYTLPLKVAWTLVYEIRFYLMFALLILFGRGAMLIFGLWLAAILARYLGWISLDNEVLTLWNLYFFCGLLAFWLLGRVPEKLGPAVLAGGLGLFAVYIACSGQVIRIANLLTPENAWMHFLLAPSFMLIVLGAALSERFVRWPAWLRLLGDASYSIYLVHSAAISALVIVAQKLRLIDRMGLHAFFIFAFLAALIVGLAAYVIVERPLLGMIKRAWTPPSSWPGVKSAARDG